jgi:hypothetical protein
MEMKVYLCRENNPRDFFSSSSYPSVPPYSTTSLMKTKYTCTQEEEAEASFMQSYHHRLNLIVKGEIDGQYAYSIYFV